MSRGEHLGEQDELTMTRENKQHSSQQSAEFIHLFNGLFSPVKVEFC